MSRLYITPRHLTLLLTCLFFSTILSFLLVRFIPFLFRPEIHLSIPAAFSSHDPASKPAPENLIAYKEKIELEGKAVFASSLTLNGHRVYIEENGIFHEEVELAEGMNTLVFEVKSMFGRKSEIVRKVVYIKK